MITFTPEVTAAIAIEKRHEADEVRRRSSLDASAAHAPPELNGPGGGHRLSLAITATPPSPAEILPAPVPPSDVTRTANGRIFHASHN